MFPLFSRTLYLNHNITLIHMQHDRLIVVSISQAEKFSTNVLYFFCLLMQHLRLLYRTNSRRYQKKKQKQKHNFVII